VKSDEIIIVSGLPRSGTSLLMQMLEAGGATLLTDENRLPDEDNPKGYLEFELVKNLRSNKEWLPLAKGNVVKVGFGEPGMRVNNSDPAKARSFRKRMRCEDPGPRWKPRWWSCNVVRYRKLLGIKSSNPW
jgi:hypothetical protein